MRKTEILVLSIILALTTTGLFAQGQHEQEDSDGEERENGEPSITATIEVDTSAEQSTSTLMEQYGDRIISLEDAQSAVRKANPSTDVVGVSLGVEGGYLVYEAATADGREILVDAADAKILSNTKDDTDTEEDEDDDGENEEEENDDDEEDENNQDDD